MFFVCVVFVRGDILPAWRLSFKSEPLWGRIWPRPSRGSYRVRQAPRFLGLVLRTRASLLGRGAGAGVSLVRNRALAGREKGAVLA